MKNQNSTNDIYIFFDTEAGLYHVSKKNGKEIYSYEFRFDNDGYFDWFILSYSFGVGIEFEIYNYGKKDKIFFRYTNYDINPLLRTEIMIEEEDILDELNSKTLNDFHVKKEEILEKDLRYIAINIIDFVDEKLEHRFHDILNRLREALLREESLSKNQ